MIILDDRLKVHHLPRERQLPHFQTVNINDFRIDFRIRLFFKANITVMQLFMSDKTAKVFKYGINGKVIQYLNVQFVGMVLEYPIMEIPSMSSIDSFDFDFVLKKKQGIDK